MRSRAGCARLIRRGMSFAIGSRGRGQGNAGQSRKNTLILDGICRSLELMDDRFARQRQLVQSHPENELARFSLGRALFDAGDFAGAREHLEVALRRKPDWMVVQILIGKCDLAQGSPDAARESFERALRLAREQHHEGPEAELLDLLSGLNPGTGQLP